MATVFWDSHGVLFTDFLEKGKTITGQYYSTLLDRLKLEMASKRPHMSKKKPLIIQDNAPSHTSTVAMAKMHNLCFALLPRPPYSPDLAPSDFFLFPELKKTPQRQEICVRFGGN